MSASPSAAAEAAYYPEGSDAPAPVIAHVLFGDVVGYSRLSTEQQARVQQRLRQAVRTSAEFNRAAAANQMICMPTGDGAAIVFFDDVCGPIRCAAELTRFLAEPPEVPIRIGIHTGYVFRITDINGKDNVAGGGINLAQRVMDCGDSGHVLLSSTHANLLQELGLYREHLKELGEAEVKHGTRIQLFNYHDGTTGRADPPKRQKNSTPAPVISIDSFAKPALPAEKKPVSCAGTRVAIIYKRRSEPDATVLNMLEAQLSARGCEVFVDRHLKVGIDWAREIERELVNADAVIPLLSPAAASSDMLAAELEIAREASERQNGKPRLLPIRINWEDPLPSAIAGTLDRVQYVLWHGPEDDEMLVNEITAALARPVEGAVRRRPLESPDGAVPLNSPYYIQRECDQFLLNAVRRRDSVVRIEGARQVGKTSLLLRGLKYARTMAYKVVFTNFQKLNVADLQSIDRLYITLGTALADQLDLEHTPEDHWNSRRSPNHNFNRFIEEEVLGKLTTPLVWGLDEVDRLFGCSFGGEVFSLFRAWREERAAEPDGPWGKLTQLLAYATEAQLFITDIHQSPFNVGLEVRLRDFRREEVADLNVRYGSPLGSESMMGTFHELVGGQPYLVRRGLHELAARDHSMEEFSRVAGTDEGPFADHLKRFLMLLSRDAALLQSMQNFLRDGRVPEERVFQRLRAIGLLEGACSAEARFRCSIYERYLRRHLS